MVKDKSKPKGPVSAYIFFTQALREEQKSKNPSKTIEIGEFSKTCSEKWKTISVKEKKKYDDMAAKDKERYQKAMKNYTPSGDDGKSKKKKKDPNAPKRPLSAFFLFCQDERPKVREANPDFGVADCAKQLAQRWAVCKNKDKYEALAVTEKAKYEKAVEKYNAKKGAKSP